MSPRPQLRGSELKRRLVHASGTGLPLPYLLGWLSWRQYGLLLLAGAAVAVALELLRLVVGFEWALFDELTRPYEEGNPAGYALYAFSVTAVTLVFAPHVAIPATLMLTLGDPVSGLLGTTREAGEPKRPRTLAAMFAVCLAVSVPFLLPAAGVAAGGAASIAAALVATVADGYKPVVRGYVVDDNASIPLAAAGAAGAVLGVTGTAPVFF
ncbi:MAG: dolichol kinase [Haloquadratum sp.]